MDNMNHLLFDFLDKHADMYEGKDAINPELYDLYKVKRGLRDKNGNGVVAGLTTISTIEAFDYQWRSESSLRWAPVLQRIRCEGTGFGNGKRETFRL